MKLVKNRSKLPKYRAPRQSSGALSASKSFTISARKTLAKIRGFRFTRIVVDRIIGVVGELLLTAGVFVLLFLGWHMWFNSMVSAIAQQQSARELSNEWELTDPTAVEFDKLSGNSAGISTAIEPPVIVSPSEIADTFATLIVPRFGGTFERSIGQGIDPKLVLNPRRIGVGHYPQSNDLGEIGNFAVAAHRTGWGEPFGEIDKLQLGDRIYIETQKGWYVYRFRNLEYVWPKGVGVLNPVPQSHAKAQDRILTLTSCHPKSTASERIIAYSTFETFIPREMGAPLEVVQVKEANQ